MEYTLGAFAIVGHYVVWVVGTIVAAVVFAQKRGKAEFLGLIGFGLMLILNLLTTFLTPHLVGVTGLPVWWGITVMFIYMVAGLCLVYAFWARGRIRT